ncbi:hypothetical protein [Microcoleus sp. CAWBG58]|uniref:hypothetical protein n=1 Tax=Microcoleus sp. CAWBG58 TaxID=2841651 RepID=UPI0025ED9A33|nr:hypothetical protein [Microcoleus sp. CAWBG58]
MSGERGGDWERGRLGEGEIGKGEKGGEGENLSSFVFSLPSVNCQLVFLPSSLFQLSTVNCQLSIVNCQLLAWPLQRKACHSF